MYATWPPSSTTTMSSSYIHAGPTPRSPRRVRNIRLRLQPYRAKFRKRRPHRRVSLQLDIGTTNIHIKLLSSCIILRRLSESKSSRTIPRSSSSWKPLIRVTASSTMGILCPYVHSLVLTSTHNRANVARKFESSSKHLFTFIYSKACTWRQCVVEQNTMQK
jgi:hypothetical protein